MTEQNPQEASPFQAIRAIDYTIIFARDMPAMRRFHEGTHAGMSGIGTSRNRLQRA